MSHPFDQRTGRGLGTRSLLRSGPLAALVMVSFLSARHAYVAHASAAQHVASLFALVIWTALLTLQVSGRVRRVREEKTGASTTPTEG